MIYIGGEKINNLAGFSNRFQMIRSMIFGSSDWLNWAIHNVETPALYYSNEDQLLIMLPYALHNDGYIRFRKFRASVEKFMEMSDSDLAQFARVYIDPVSEISLPPLIEKNGIISYSEINSALDFISHFCDKDQPLFKCPGFTDMLWLAALSKQTEGISSSKRAEAFIFASREATDFAYTIEITIEAFCDLSCFFILASTSYPSESIRNLYNHLLPLTYPLLFTPFATLVKNELVAWSPIKEAIESSRFIGYNTCESALHNFANNPQLLNLPDFHEQFALYAKAIKYIVSSATKYRRVISQTGQVTTFIIEKEENVVMIGVNKAGCVFLLPDTKIKPAN